MGQGDPQHSMGQGDQIHRYGTVRSANTGSQVPAPNGYCVSHDSELSPSVTKRPSDPRRRAARYDIMGDLPSRLGLVTRSSTTPQVSCWHRGLCGGPDYLAPIRPGGLVTPDGDGSPLA